MPERSALDQEDQGIISMGRQEKERKQKKFQQNTVRQPIQRQSMFEAMRGQPASSALDHLQVERTKYAEKWANSNAARFEADGHYAWMASFLEGYGKVLEIGPGDGRGTLALLHAGHTVVGVDENPVILEIARTRLMQAEKDVAYEAREKTSLSSRGYEVRYGYPQKSPGAGGALLLDGDIQNDPKLLKWLGAHGPFDAVACWLIGTHHARTYNEVFDAVNIRNVMEYRLSVQNRVYELADAVLRPGGVLHVVDRGQPLETEHIRQNCITNHRDQARDTSLEVFGCEERYYEEAEADGGVEMIPTSTTGGPIPELPQLSLTSVLSKKPGSI